MVEIKCANCEKTFYRKKPLRWPIRCPSCQLLLPELKTQYASREFRVLSKIAAGVQKKLGMANIRRIEKLQLKRRILKGFAGESFPLDVSKAIKLEPKRVTLRRQRWSKFRPLTPVLRPFTGRHLLAHEIAHTTAPGSEALNIAALTALMAPKQKHAIMQTIAHGSTFKSSRRHVEKVMKRTGAWKQLRKLGYADEEKKRRIVGPIIGGTLAAGVVAQRLHPTSRAVQKIQKVAGVPRTGALPILPRGGRIGGAAPSRYLPILTMRKLRSSRTRQILQKGGITPRRLLAHEVAHQTKLGQRASHGAWRGIAKASKLAVGAALRGRPEHVVNRILKRGGIDAELIKRWKAGVATPQDVTRMRRSGHKPLHRVAWRHVERLMKRKGLWGKLRKLGYALDTTRDPKYVRSYNTEMKQHGVSFSTRLQFLSRVYGGRGGYTSEELYKIVTGRTKTPVFIFPFVKSAPPEVNRILQSAYRRHRAKGATKQSAAVAAWTNVKRAGYVKRRQLADVWVKERPMIAYENKEAILRKKSLRRGAIKGAIIGGAIPAAAHAIHSIPRERLLRRIKKAFAVRKAEAIQDGLIIPNRPKSWGAQIHEGRLMRPHRRKRIMRESAVDTKISGVLKSLRKGRPNRFGFSTRNLLRGVGIAQGAMGGALLGGVLGLESWRRAKEKRKMTKYAREIDPRILKAKAEVAAEKILSKGIERGVQRTVALRAKDVTRAARETKWAAATRPTLEARLAKGVKGFVGRHAGLLSMLIAAPAIASEIQLLIRKIDQKRAIENYALVSAGLGGRRKVIRKLVGKSRRRRQFRQRIMRFPARNPRLMTIAGGAGLGAWGMRRLQQRQQQQQYADTPVYPRLSTGTSAASTTPRVASKVWSATKKVGKPALRTGAKVALGGLISWITISILHELEKKRIPAIGPYMPDVRPDIEMARYTIGRVVTSVDDIPTRQLYALQGKAAQVLTTIKGLPHKAKVTTEKGLLMWLLGFISAEILGRGLTTPKRRIRVEGEVPIRQVPYGQAYGRSVIPMDSGHREHLKGISPLDPKGWAAENKAFDVETKRMVKGIKRDRRRAAASTVVGTVRRHPRRVAGAMLPWVALAGLVAARQQRKRKRNQLQQQKYFAAATAVKGAVKAGKWATTKKWGNRAFTAMIVADVASAVIPRKKRPPTSIQTGPVYRAPQHYTVEPMVMYPLRSASQRRWMHATRPKMAKEWEEHTPAGKLPEKVSKHAAWPIARAPIRRLMGLRWLAVQKGKIKGKDVELSKGMLEVANRIIAERKVLAAAGVVAGVGGVMAGKRLERRRIKKAIG